MANSSNLAFCLEYSQHESDMLETFYDYLRNESLVDVMLSCDGNIIKAHKMVLSAGSPYFRNIFDAIKSPWQVPVIVIKDMPFRDLKAIVEFLYRGEVVVPMEQVESLNKSAQTLFIKGLEKYFNNSARVNVDRNNAQTRPENRGLSPKKAGTARTQTTATSFRTTAQRPEPNPQTIAQTTSRSQTSVSSMNNQKPQPPINTNAKNTPKQKPKPANSSANSTPTISMRLRKNRRPDYRQLSNGDFSSDDDSIHEIIMNCPEISPKFQNSVRTYSKTNPILKREIRLKEDREQMCDDEEEDINEAMMINRGHTNIASVQNSIDSQMATTSRIFAPNVPRVTTGIGLPTSSRKSIRQPDTGPIQTSTPIAGRPVPRPMPIKLESEVTESYRCTLCPRIFTKANSLATHTRRVHQKQDVAKHACKICGNEYSWRSGLYKHMKVHRKEDNQQTEHQG